jgi:hypothetical protein
MQGLLRYIRLNLNLRKMALVNCSNDVAERALSALGERHRERHGKPEGLCISALRIAILGQRLGMPTAARVVCAPSTCARMCAVRAGWFGYATFINIA